MSLTDAGPALQEIGRSMYLTGVSIRPEQEIGELDFDTAISMIAGVSDEFTDELDAIPFANDVVDQDNGRFDTARSFRRYAKVWLPGIEQSPNGAEFAECGDRSWPSAIAYPYSFGGGSHKSLLSRTRLLFDLTRAWGLVDEDGVPFRVIGIPTPAFGWKQGAHIGMSIKDQWEIVNASRDPEAVDTHQPLTQHILDGLEQLGVRRLFLPGYSDGGLMAILLGDHAVTNQHSDIDVLGVSSGNPPGSDRSHPWLPIAIKQSLDRLRNQPGDTRTKVQESGSLVLRYLDARDARVGPRLNAARLVLRSLTPDNLTKGAIVSGDSARRPLRRLLDGNAKVNYVLTDQDPVSYPERLATWLPAYRRSYDNLRVFMGQGHHDQCSGLGYLMTLLTLAVVPAVEEGRVYSDVEDWGAFASPSQ